MSTKPHGIVLFDGVCNLCSASVNFIMSRDKSDYFQFAALQSDAGKAMLAENGFQVGTLDTLVLQEGRKVYTRSTAALRIARRLSGAWPLVYALIIIPRSMRDFAYDVIAKNRYRLFDKRETCRVPTPEERGKFLS
jgi:predicted DCC family thiol-disulfide oxidoreductase YuxK